MLRTVRKMRLIWASSSSLCLKPWQWWQNLVAYPRQDANIVLVEPSQPTDTFWPQIAGAYFQKSLNWPSQISLHTWLRVARRQIIGLLSQFRVYQMYVAPAGSNCLKICIRCKISCRNQRTEKIVWDWLALVDNLRGEYSGNHIRQFRQIHCKVSIRGAFPHCLTQFLVCSLLTRKYDLGLDNSDSWHLTIKCSKYDRTASTTASRCNPVVTGLWREFETLNREALTGMGAFGFARLISCGLKFSKHAFLAASTGSSPVNGGSCSKSSNKIMAQEYTSTCNFKLWMSSPMSALYVSYFNLSELKVPVMNAWGRSHN